MAGAVPQTKINEAWELVTHLGLKDLRPFSALSKRRLVLRRSLEALLKHPNTDDQVSAYMGLGLLAHYENKFEDALRYFKYACHIEPNNAVVVSNYARALGSAGYPEQSAEMFLEVLRLNPTDHSTLQYLVRLCLDYLLLEQFDLTSQLCAVSVEPEVHEEVVRRIKEAVYLRNFLDEHAIPIEVYRSLNREIECLLYRLITVPTPLRRVRFYDVDCDVLSSVIRVGAVEPDKVADLNDALCDVLLDWVDAQAPLYPEGELRRMFNCFTFYFMPLESAHVG